MLLKNKIAVIYGAGGAIGGAAARSFAREGAKVFITGNRTGPLEPLAREIREAGGSVETAVLDSLDGQAIDLHLAGVVKKEGRVDISFNAAGIGQTGVQGIPLVELSAEQFLRPVEFYAKSHFLTATAAARHMIPVKTGVILTLTAIPSRIAAPLVGGMAPAWSAVESLTRTLAGELGPHGIRVVCLRPDGIPESETITEVYGLHAKGIGMPSHKEFQSLMESMTLLKRLPRLAEVGDTAAFIASEWAGAMTGTVVNLSCGSVVD